MNWDYVDIFVINKMINRLIEGIEYILMLINVVFLKCCYDLWCFNLENCWRMKWKVVNYKLILILWGIGGGGGFFVWLIGGGGGVLCVFRVEVLWLRLL